MALSEKAQELMAPPKEAGDRTGMKMGTRHLVVYLENDTIEADGIAKSGLFCFEAARALREYADMVDSGHAGRHACETYTSTGGTRLTAIGSKWSGAQLPLEKINL